MFRENTNHLQMSFFDIGNQLSKRKKKKIRESEGIKCTPLSRPLRA